MKIGDLFLGVVASLEGFEADLVKKSEKAGDAGGKTLGQRMGAGVKAHGAKIIGGVLAGGFALATKGLLELEQVTADFAAETGASADEANRAGKAINAMSGRNLQPVTEIGEALTKVHTDLGLTGDEAERTTQLFLKFGRATKQNAAKAVLAFDDILDAWGLTAADAGGIMDKLIVSHQKYGGSIEDNQRSLAELAPALRAANLTADDGIGLLNLFAASGVDSAAAVTGMTKALSRVESPEELKVLIADIIATEDPFERAQKAADLFGVKAGAKLANALRPGAQGLEDYQISAEDAAGATEKAAAVLDSTFGARFQLLMKGAGAAITGFGSNFGPAVTGMASLASLGASMGGGRLVGAISGGLASAWRKVAASTVVTKAIAFASGKAATIYLAGLIAGDAIGGALSKAWLATGGRLLAAAAISGTAAGTAFAAASAAAIIAAPVAVILVALKIRDDLNVQSADIGTRIGEQIATGTIAELQASRAAIVQGINDLLAIPDLGIFTGEQIGNLKAQALAIDAAIAGMTDNAADVASAVTDSGRDTEAAFGGMGSAAAVLAATIGVSAGKIKSIVRALTSQLAAEARAMINGFYDPLILRDNLAAANAEIAAARRVLASATATTAEKRDARETLHSLGKDQAEYLLQLAEAGDITSKSYATGLANLRDAIKTAKGPAKAALQEILDKILQVEAAGKVVPINVRVSGNRGVGPNSGFAHGGIRPAGVASWVGERGRELSIPLTPSLIIPHAASEALVGAAGGGGATYNVTVNNPEPRAADADIGRMMRRISALGITAR